MIAQPDRRQVFARGLAVLSETFNEPLSELRAEAYLVALEDLSADEFEQAVRAALRACRFFPRPVELRELVRGSATALADEAWGQVLREVRRVGWTGTPSLPPAVMRTVQHVWGNWRHLCETLPGDGPELLGWAKQFKASHEITTQRLLASGDDGIGPRAALPSNVRAFIANYRKGESS